MAINRPNNNHMIFKNMDAEKAGKILAKSLYKELLNNGFTNKDIIYFFKEMFNYMTYDIRKQHDSKESSSKDLLIS